MAKASKLWEQEHTNRMITIGVLFLTILLILIISVSHSSNADANASHKEIYSYTSVKIEYGDTLWGIANEYCSNDFSSTVDAVKEIKRLNGLKSNKIKAGNYILVPVFIEVDE